MSLTLDPISNINVPGGKTLIVPLTSTSTTTPVTYSVQSSNPLVTTTLHTGDPFLQLTLSDPGVAGIDGQTITIQLYPEDAPNNVQRLISRVNAGFYNGLSFYRIVPGFVIQGGNQVGTGPNLDDEYAPESIFDTPGKLAIANSGDDTNQSEFFITTTTNNAADVAQQRALDFNFTVLGQVVRGQSVVDLISQQPASGQSATPPITITSAQIIPDQTDNTLTVFAPTGQSATITVTASNGVDPNSVQMFTATGVADTVNDPPFLGSVANQTTTAGTPVTFTLTSTDLENDPAMYEAILQGASAANATVSVNGAQVTVTPNAGFTGSLSLLVGVADQGATTRGNDNVIFDTQLMTITVNPAPPGGGGGGGGGGGTTSTSFTSTIIAVGADAGGGPQVNVYDASTLKLKASFFAFAPTFSGGVRVAVGDVNGDGTPDIIAAAGPSTSPEVRVFDGKTFNLIRDFFAFTPTFGGGVFVAAADLNHDGFTDIIVGADAGGGPEVRVFDGKTGALLRDFFAFAPNFTGGVRVAVGDVNGDGTADIVTGAGPGGGPQVTVFDFQTLKSLLNFYGLNSAYTDGIFVAAGDTDGDGKAEIIVGSGTTHPVVGPVDGYRVAVFNSTGTQTISFTPYPSSSFSGGSRVGVDFINGRALFLLAAGPGGASEVKIYNALTNAVVDDFFALPAGFTGGSFVAGG